jgi:hypothetical protein
VLVTSNGFNLTAVYSPEALADRGFVDATFDPRFAWLRPVQSNEPEWDRILLRRGVDGALGHPDAVARVLARNVAQTAELAPGRNVWAEQMDGRNLAFRAATLPVFYLTAALGLAGLWRHRRDRRARLVFLLGLSLVVPSVFTVVAPRLRAPLDLALSVGAGILVAPAAPRTGTGSTGTGATGDGRAGDRTEDAVAVG